MRGRNKPLLPLILKMHLFVWIEFEQHIRLYFKDRCNIEHHLQGQSPDHVGSLNCTHMLTADAHKVRYLFLGELLPLAIVCNRTADIPIAFRVLASGENSQLRVRTKSWTFSRVFSALRSSVARPLCEEGVSPCLGAPSTGVINPSLSLPAWVAAS